MRALLDDPSFGSEPLHVSGAAAPARRVAGGDVTSPSYIFECAGVAFAERFDFPNRKTKKTADCSAESDGESEEGEDYGSKGKSPKDKATGSLKISEVLKGVDLYGLLGVPEAASQEEIKRAYRALALSAHPDKQVTANAAEAKKVQERFVQIQEAYELLSDSARRMQYDSSLDFDDSLPKFKPEGGQDFFEVFGEAFRRNARFSVKRPVPDLGTASSTPQEWKRFYSFWFEFQSWRDPLMLAQKEGEELMDLNDAECREEKRWMMRENARVAKAYKQAERERLMDLVRLAEKFDPRILAEKEAKRAAREAEAERRREEKMAVQRAREEAERKRREEEEAVRKAEEERRLKEKAVREAAKAQVKKCRQRLRSFHPQVKSMVLLDQLNEVCLQFEESQMRKLGDEVEEALRRHDAPGAAARYHDAIASLGLTPCKEVKAEVDTESTSSGPSSEDPATAEELRQRTREQEERRRAAELRKKEEEAAKAEERARLAAEKAEQKRVKDEQRRKEQAAAEAKRRQLEKKEEERAKKQVEKKQREEEQEALRKQKEREENRQKALEQAEKDRAAAEAAKEEQENERLSQMYAADRIERLNKLDFMSAEALTEQLEKACAEDMSIPAALRLLQASCYTDTMLDRQMALLSKIDFVWPLGLQAPAASIRPPNNVRNRCKKARQQLRDLVAAFIAKGLAPGDESSITEWQRGIVDGSLELPTWSAQEAEEKAKQAQQTEKEKPSAAKKAKKAKEAPKGEENLDDLLAEFGMTPAATSSKKNGKKKK